MTCYDCSPAVHERWPAGEIAGETLDEATGEITFTDVDVSEFDTDPVYDYTTISGTFTPSEDGTKIMEDLRFDGGPVVMMQYTLTEQFMDDSVNAASASIDVIANYQDFTSRSRTS